MQKKQNSFMLALKPSIFFILFFSCLYTKAQDDEVDSTITDSVKGIITETATDKVKFEESDKHYFLRKDQYEHDSVQIRAMPDSWLKQLRDDDDYWYANAEIKKEKAQGPEPHYTRLSDQRWFQTLLWVLIIGGFIAIIIWYLTSSNVSIFRRQHRIVGNAEGEEKAEDIFAINYQKEIDKASKMGNYRLAIRLMFLRLLKDLSQKNIIQYAQGKTNFEYLVQLHSTKYYKDFFRITRNYEYSWYGQFDVTEDMYHIIRSDFNNFDRQLR